MLDDSIVCAAQGGFVSVSSHGALQDLQDWPLRWGRGGRRPDRLDRTHSRIVLRLCGGTIENVTLSGSVVGDSSLCLFVCEALCPLSSVQHSARSLEHIGTTWEFGIVMDTASAHSNLNSLYLSRIYRDPLFMPC